MITLIVKEETTLIPHFLQLSMDSLVPMLRSQHVLDGSSRARVWRNDCFHESTIRCKFREQFLLGVTFYHVSVGDLTWSLGSVASISTH